MNDRTSRTIASDTYSRRSYAQLMDEIRVAGEGLDNLARPDVFGSELVVERKERDITAKSLLELFDKDHPELLRQSRRVVLKTAAATRSEQWPREANA